MADWRTHLADVRARCTHRPIVTGTLIAAVLATALRFRVFDHELPLDTSLRYGFSGRALSMRHWSTLLTSQLLTRDAFMAVSIVCSLALMLGVYEAVAGSVRATVVTAVTAVAGPLALAGALGLGSQLGITFAARTLQTLDYGASAITAGAGGALVAVLPYKKLRWFALAWVAGGLVLHHQLADWEHLFSFTAGYGVGHVLGTPRAPVGTHHRRSSTATVHATVHATVRKLTPLGAAGIVGALVAGTIVAPRGQTSVFAVGPAGTTPARITSITYPAPSLGGPHRALVVLPAGYDNSSARYPVVEMLHGRPGSPSDIITGLDPIGASLLPGMSPFIGVIPDGHGPVVYNGEFADTSRQRLGTAVSDDLQRYVGSHYRTNHHSSLIGLSSGGYAAAYLGSRHASQYDRVCSMSGNFTPEGPAFTTESGRVIAADSPILHARSNGPNTLLIAGSSDPTTVRDAQHYAHALAIAGQAHQVVIVPGGHDWSLWHREFPRCLRYVLTATTSRGAR